MLPYLNFGPCQDSAFRETYLLSHSLIPSTGSTINRLMLSFCVNASLIKVVLESPPVVHRLRLLSSA